MMNTRTTVGQASCLSAFIRTLQTGWKPVLLCPAFCLLQSLPVIALATMGAFSLSALAQPTNFTYQGRLDDDGNPANGFYDLRFELFDSPTNGVSVGALTNAATDISDGLFTVTLDYGASVFDGADRWLELGAVTNGGGTFMTLSPRQQITSTPYAIKAADAMAVDMGVISDPTFIGTTSSNAPLDLFVNNQRGLRLEYATSGGFESVNLIGGYSGNSIANNTEGALIVGGGTSGYENAIGVNADYSMIGGGFDNTIASNSTAATITGGAENATGVNADYSATGGGVNNDIADNSSYATIAGGRNNDIGVSSSYSAVGGGVENNISSNAAAATISGGQDNDIGVNALVSAIGGGFENNISSNAASATIAGGSSNDIGVNAAFSATGGGNNNDIADNSSYATIAGGRHNDIGVNSDYSAIGGGIENNIASNVTYAVIPGGRDNDVGADADYALAAGRRAQANHTGAFVWADSQDADFNSQGTNTFNVRSAGGVRLNTDTDLFFGNQARQMINLFSTDYAIGIQSGTVYSRTLSRFSWFLGGQHSDTQNDPGAGGSVLMTLTSGGLTVNGVFVSSSDRNLKEQFKPVDPCAVLEKVAALPLSEWNFKEDEHGTRHLGPMAQDFHAAFGLNGADDKHIATVDADGIALAAIQGLNQKLEQKNAKIAKMERELAELKALMAQITTQLNRGK